MKEKWKQSEDRTAANFGRKTPGSGSGNEKLDILGEGIYEGLRFENKFTEKKSRSISLEELNKARNQALAMNSDWAFVLDFDFIVRGILLSENKFINIMEELDELRKEVEHLRELLSK